MAYPGQQPPVQPNMYTPTSLAYGPSEGNAPPYSGFHQGMPPYPGITQSPPPNYGQATGSYPPPSNYPMSTPAPVGFQQAPQYHPQPPHSGPSPYAPPVTQQPLAVNWMNAPQRPVNCPPGLEYLTMIDQLLVHQKVESQ